MAELQETQQEKLDRWEAQRVERATQNMHWRAARSRTRRRNWLIGAAIVIAVLIVVRMLL
jgi:hypothetical protein